MKFLELIKEFINWLMDDELIWINTTFMILFMLAGILNGVGLYNLNESIIYSFSLGAFLFTISDITNSLYVKRIIFTLGMFSIVILPNCDSVINFIKTLIRSDNLVIYSIVLIFMSTVINAQKRKSKEKIKKLKEEGETLRAYIKCIKKIANGNNIALEEILKYDDGKREELIKSAIKMNEDVINDLNKIK